jgi:hypothetical protein
LPFRLTGEYIRHDCLGVWSDVIATMFMVFDFDNAQVGWGVKSTSGSSTGTGVSSAPSLPSSAGTVSLGASTLTSTHLYQHLMANYSRYRHAPALVPAGLELANISPGRILLATTLLEVLCKSPELKAGGDAC